MSTDKVAKFILNSAESLAEGNYRRSSSDVFPDDMSTSSEPHRRATFGLSQSDFEDSEVGSIRGSQNDLHFDDGWVADSAKNEDCGAFKRNQPRLSAILAISADERIERGLLKKHGEGDAPEKLSVSAFHDPEFEYLETERVRRCTSLKTGKLTGSGCETPSLKKVVRFADALGLDLENIKQIMDSEEPPLVPLSALRDLNVKHLGASSESDSTINANKNSSIQVCCLCFCFAQPGCMPDFTRRVDERRVALESCVANDVAHTLTGIVRVANIAYRKTVTIRWTVNGWLTYNDDEASYLVGSTDGRSDCFTFLLQLPDYFEYGSSLEFSIMYRANDEVFWDSNFGANYRVECYMKTEPAQNMAVKDWGIKRDRFY